MKPTLISTMNPTLTLLTALLLAPLAALHAVDASAAAPAGLPPEAKLVKVREDLPLMLVPPRVREFNEPKLLEGRQHTAYPGIARTPRGRLWVCWGAGEDGPGGYSMMASSDDEGRTWSKGLLLDERAGVSYPDIAQAPNGDVYVHYDRDRGGAAEILFARFREEDVQAGRLVTSNAAFKQLVKSRARGMQQPSAATPK